jgi:hypothetical protein
MKKETICKFRKALHYMPQHMMIPLRWARTIPCANHHQHQKGSAGRGCKPRRPLGMAEVGAQERQLPSAARTSARKHQNPTLGHANMLLMFLGVLGM